MLSHSQLFPLLSQCLGRIGALMAENSVAAVWVTNDPKVPCVSTAERWTASGFVGCGHWKSEVVLTGCRWHAQVRAFVVADLLPSWGFEVRRQHR